MSLLQKKALIVTYYFPPSGGPGVQRIIRLIKHLRSFGWEPVVLTVKNGDYPTTDASLLDKIPPDVKVYRTFIPEPYRLYRKLTGRATGEPVDLSTLSVPLKIRLGGTLSLDMRLSFLKILSSLFRGGHPLILQLGPA